MKKKRNNEKRKRKKLVFFQQALNTKVSRLLAAVASRGSSFPSLK